MSENLGSGDGSDSGRQRLFWLAVVAVALVLVGAGAYFVAGGSSNPYNVTSGADGVVYNATGDNATGGPRVVLRDGLQNTTVRQPFPDGHTIYLYNGTGGVAYVEAADHVEAELAGYNRSAEWTRLTNMLVSRATLTVDAANTTKINVTGGTDHLEYRDPAVDDGRVDFRYGGPDGGTTTLTLTGLPANTAIAAWNQSGTRLDWNTSTSAGELTLRLPQSDHSVELREANAPTFDESTATPEGGQSEYPDEFAIDVDHPDFPETTVDVEFFLNGESIGNDTLSAAGAANTTSPSQIPAGQNQWYAVATDEYGNTNQSSTINFSVPETLEIRDEENPSQLVTDANAALEFYFDDGSEQIVERSASGGTVNMTGLPTDQSFVAVADAEGYHARRIFVRSLFESQRIYLLNESSQHVDVTFQLEDFTGDYPEADTVLIVERNINGSWGVVQGDFFGATGEWTAQLAYNVRHRLTLLNTETGQERRVGTFTPVSSGTQTIRVLRTSVELRAIGPTVSVEPQTRTLPATTTSLTAAVDENDAELDYWRVNVTVRNATAAQTLYTETLSGPSGGSVSPSVNLTGWEGGTVEVNVEVATSDGGVKTQQVNYRVSEWYDHQNSLYRTVLAVPGVLEIGGGGTTLLAAIVTVVVSASVARFSAASSELVAATAVGCTIAFAVVGWMPWELVFAAAVTFAGLWTLWRGI